MDPALREAVLAAQNIQAPASPLGAPNAPELAKLYAASFQLPQATVASKAQAQNAQEKVKQDEYAAKIAAQKEADKADFKAYRVVKKSDGGYDFFDPDGQQVDIATLTQRTGVNPVDILKDSENPIDIQYVQDYNNLQDFVRAVLSGDRKKVESYTAAKPELNQYKDKDGINRLIQDFRQAYQRYYIPRSINPQAWGAKVPGSAVVPTGLTGADALLGASGGI